MAFSSSSHAGNSNIRRGVAAGWTRSLLPFTSSNTKSAKHIRKSRKRTALKDFIFANFFIIGLAVSIVFFLLVVYSYGVPRPISSQFRISNSRVFKLRKPVYRKTPFSRLLSSNHTNLSLGAAAVDLTTRDLYDKIEFKDVDGGPWTQGWRVSYKGEEWDTEKLKVFVVPHSHNDPGWKLTVEEYYDRQSRHILDTVVETLSKDERRKFIWEEMSYLERWWRDASDAKRDSFTNLVQNGQLEIVGGGWVMNDEVITIQRPQVLFTITSFLVLACIFASRVFRNKQWIMNVFCGPESSQL